MGGNNVKPQVKLNKVIPHSSLLKAIDINIATLKIGQSYSPLQFYPQKMSDHLDQGQFDKILNQKFHSICQFYKKQEVRFKTDEQISLKYENKMTKKRYTPLFDNFGSDGMIVGIKDNVYLMNRQQFEKRWDDTFEAILRARKKQKQSSKKSSRRIHHAFSSIEKNSYMDKVPQLKSTVSLEMSVQKDIFEEEEYQRKLRIFDTMTYHTLLAYIYDQQNCTIDQIAEKHYSFKYKCFMENLYASERSSLQKRMRAVINYVKKKKIGIMLLQETSQEGLKMLVKLSDQYRISRTHFDNHLNQSAIMIKKSLFQILEPNRTHWTLGALNALYLQDFVCKGNQIPQPITREQKDEVQNKDSVTRSFRMKKSVSIVQKDNLMKMFQKEEPDSNKIFINEEETNINYIENKNLREDMELIQTAQKKKNYSVSKGKGKKLAPIFHQSVKRSTLLQPYPKLANSGKLRKTKEKIFQEKIGLDFITKLNFPQNTIIQFIGRLILISSQIQQKNLSLKQENIEDVLKMVEYIKQKYPNHQIIMGLDIDSDLEVDGSVKIHNNVESILKKGFHAIPNLPVLHKNENPTKRMAMNYFQAVDTFTINYTKTNFQFDRKNVGEKIIGCNNFVISTQNISNNFIETAKGTKLNYEDSLPNQDHPFINYFVRGSIHVDLGYLSIKQE